jgi:hypothetical protein
LSCIFHVIDHALYGIQPTGYHVTNLLLWGLLLVMVVLVFREFARDFKLGSMTVLVAGLFFAVDSAHTLNVIWIAHRYVLLGTFFSAWSVLHYHRFRRDGKKRSMLFSLALCGLALLSDEGAVAVVLWVAAYELCLGSGRPIERIRAAVPIATLVVGYVIFYGLMGFGSAGIHFYLNPLEEPLAFVKETFLERIPFLIVGALTPIEAQIGYGYFIFNKMWLLVFAWGLGLAVLALFVPHVLRNKTARFMALGGLLTMLTRTSAYPHDRMLLLPTVGIAWMLASYVTEALRFRRSKREDTSAEKTRRGVWAAIFIWAGRVVAVVVIAIHGLLSPLQATWTRRAFDRENKELQRIALESEMPGPEEVRDSRILMLPTFGVNVIAVYRSYLKNMPYPEAVWAITPPEVQTPFTCGL